jgi:5'-nucleotidase
MTWILVTNDDGIDAKALLPLSRALGEIATVRVVAPDIERSWVGKAITRFEPVEVTRIDVDGMEMYSCTGYPADCVQVGANSMFDEPPALVVSGINLGQNHGSAYLQSSGTVGAALEASLSGVDGLAVSAGMQGDFHKWREWALTEDSLPMWERLSAITVDLAATMLEAGPQGVALSVNLPDHADLDTQRRLTTVADTRYERLFRQESPGRFVHDYQGGLHHDSTLDGTDIGASADGFVAITPVRTVTGLDLPELLSPLLHPRDL